MRMHGPKFYELGRLLELIALRTVSFAKPWDLLNAYQA